MAEPTQTTPSSGKLASPQRQQMQGRVFKMLNPITRRNRSRPQSHPHNHVATSQNASFEEAMRAMDEYEEEDFDLSWKVLASPTTQQESQKRRRHNIRNNHNQSLSPASLDPRRFLSISDNDRKNLIIDAALSDPIWNEDSDSYRL